MGMCGDCPLSVGLPEVLGMVRDVTQHDGWAGMWYCGAASCAVHSAVVVQGPETLPELRGVEGSLLWVRGKGCECWQP